MAEFATWFSIASTHLLLRCANFECPGCPLFHVCGCVRLCLHTWEGVGAHCYKIQAFMRFWISPRSRMRATQIILSCSRIYIGAALAHKMIIELGQVSMYQCCMASWLESVTRPVVALYNPTNLGWSAYTLFSQADSTANFV